VSFLQTTIDPTGARINDIALEARCKFAVDGDLLVTVHPNFHPSA
jgi:hypothetical protein